MAILAPQPNDLAVRVDPPPALVERTTATLSRTILDQHAEARERIADLLDSPRSDTLTSARAAVRAFLETERQLVLLHPVNRAELCADLRTVLDGRRAIRLALARVSWSQCGTAGLARSVEALRHAFLAHADCYGRRPATHERSPIALAAASRTNPGRTSTMDLIDQLTTEHREAESLLAQLKETEPGAERDALVEQLTTALRTHMAVEERFVYPIVAEVVGREPEEEAEVEHTLAREGLATLDRLRSEPGFGAAVDMLEAGIAHHVEEEEGEVFPKLRQEVAPQIAELDPAECKEAVQGDTIDLTRDELYRRAQEADIPGRSSMTKDELAEALAER